ncbi:3-dehydroquinate synthase [Clostridium polyendosporum]|uniref:3-dehydroquinate synthase n=1 Tax=Clostridium polyendosporum TaxID=69208 RepID=A0A919S0E4_9CLOT|nr:3-dehydroquinate synthase [Clostridium polyendosporum]GIM29527.1 3-dehydroquinate synthase [Clostridium polyendosporum]
MRTLEVKLKDNSYNIYIQRGILSQIGQCLKENFKSNKIAIITDHNLNSLYGAVLNKTISDKGFIVKTISIKPGEESKCFDTLQQVYKELSDFKITRDDLIIAFGGGVVGDLCGFAASTYLRGIPYIQVPTSLLAQVDSSVGGKVAVDLPWGKNLVGSFYHPKAVFIDPELLKTLSKKFLHDGLAEVIKYGCIKDGKIIDKLMGYKDDEELLENIEEIIYTCCDIKRAVVESDEKDFGDRMLLNFGHTLGHAIEKYFNYGQYSHGEAVGIGMVEITKKSELLGITEEGTSKVIEKVLDKYELPYELPSMNRADILDTITLDKKNLGENINLIMIRKIGEGFINKVRINEIDSHI